jgi:hypothetical protein
MKQAIIAKNYRRSHCAYLPIVSLKFVCESISKVQAEGGFGSRRFDIGCLVSALSLDLNNSPTPKQLGPHPIFYRSPTWVQIGLIESW